MKNTKEAVGTNTVENSMMISRMINIYKEQVVPKIMEKFKITNTFAVPQLEKIVLSMGISQNKNFQENLTHLTLIAGQKAIPTKAKNSISQFSVREGMEIGAKVTLRGNQMYHFFNRLIIALLNWRAFDGVNKKSFNVHKNTICLSMGFQDKRLFQEIRTTSSNYKSDGFNITFCIKSKNKEATVFMLEQMGLPFKG